MNKDYVSAQRKALIAVVKDRQYEMLLTIPALHFQEQNFRAIYDGVISCISMGQPISEDTVKDAIRSGALKQQHKDLAIAVLGNLMGLNEVYPPTLPSVLAEQYRVHVVENTVEELTDENATDKSRVEAVRKAYEAMIGGGIDGAQEFTDIASQYFDRMERGENTKMVERSIELHNPHLSAMFGPRIYPAPYAICGQPGFRKSGVLLNLIVEAAIVRHKNVLVYTFEDSAETFMAKLAACKYTLPYSDIVGGSLGERMSELKPRLTKTKWPVRIDDRQWSYPDWQMDVRRQCMTRKVDMIVVDFVQAFTYNRNHEVAELNMITKGMRQLSKEFLVPIIFASQVNDRESDRKTGEVVLSSGAAKGSGSINEDVRFLACIDGRIDDDEKRFKVFKNTWGPCRWSTVRFDGPSGTITATGRVGSNDNE